MPMRRWPKRTTTSGLALFDAGQIAEAIKELEQVVRSGAGRPEAYLALGTAYIEAARLDEADRRCHAGHETRSGARRPADSARARIPVEGTARQGRDRKSIEHGRSPIPPLPAPLPSTSSSSSTCIRTGPDQDEARPVAAAAEAFKKVLAMDPNHGPTNNHLAEAYLQQGLFKLASEHAARAAKAGSPLPETERQLIGAGLAGKKPGARE